LIGWGGEGECQERIESEGVGNKDASR